MSVLLSGATTISLSLWVFQATGNPLDLAVIVALRTAISIYLAPFAGALADRLDRRTLIVSANAGLAAMAVVMLALTTISGASMVGPICLALAASGVLDSVLLSSLAASVRDVRTEANLMGASALISLLESAPLIVAPLLGSLVYGAWGIQPVLVADALSFVVAAVAVASAHWSPESGATTHAGARWRMPFQGAVAGLSMIWANRDYRRLQLGNAMNNLTNGLATTAVTVFLLSSVQGGTGVLGMYNSAAAMGLVGGAAVMALLGTRLPRSWTIAVGMLVAALAGRVVLGLASAPIVWVISGLARSIGVQLNNVSLSAIWLEATPRSDQGKVFGARRLLGQGGYPLAVMLGGLAIHAPGDTAGTLQLSAWLIGLGVVEVVVALALVGMGVVRRVGSAQAPPLLSHGSVKTSSS